MGSIKLEFSEILDVDNYTNNDGSRIEDTPEERLRLAKWNAMNVLFHQFENVERKNLHEAESEKFLIEILGNIAKAKVEKKSRIFIKEGFLQSEIKPLEKGTEFSLRKDTIDNLILAKSNSEYYHGFASTETIFQERKIGIMYMTILKLWKRRRNLSLSINTNDRLPFITIIW